MKVQPNFVDKPFHTVKKARQTVFEKSTIVILEVISPFSGRSTTINLGKSYKLDDDFSWRLLGHGSEKFRYIISHSPSSK